jgi:hypothetical protein
MLECPGQGTCLEVDGSNLYAGIDHLPYDGTTGRCSYNFTKGQEIQIYYNSPGVWYEVKGTGGAITASTCGQAWEFSTLIEVYKLKSGESGCGTIQPFDNLECVTWLGSMAIPCGPDQECDCAQSKVCPFVSYVSSDMDKVKKCLWDLCSECFCRWHGSPKSEKRTRCWSSPSSTASRTGIIQQIQGRCCRRMAEVSSLSCATRRYELSAQTNRDGVITIPFGLGALF